MNEDGKQVEAQEVDTPVDDWAAAFAALDEAPKEDAEPDAGKPDTAQVADGQAADDHAAGAEQEPATDIGGPGDIAGGDREGDVLGAVEAINVSQADIDTAEKEIRESARQEAMRQVEEMFMKADGIRRSNGRLGATVNDPDICKKDRDGVPVFYNPETGKRFTGDNPRRQAQEWCDDYNKELARVFDNKCKEVEDGIVRQNEPRLNTLRFAPTYDSLDPVRQAMLDALIEDYEVRDSDGDIIGYSCDLNVALAQVNRQIAGMQRYAANKPKPATGPATDMKSSSGAQVAPDKSKINSLEDAFNYLYEQEKNNG